ncbi:MAG: DMT family transporter [Bacteroidales bacterium]|jgi:drug/metabolite transporter (DMT)-like permease|nr:DMT family transporter [Bacteroidales bacterium]
MKSIKGIIFALISSGTFGLIPLFSIPMMRNGVGVPTILFYRFLLSAVIMGIICLISGKKFNISKKEAGISFVLTLFYASTALGLFISYLYIPSGVATTIHFLYPVVVTLIMTIFFKEKKTVKAFIAAGLSLVGVGFLTWSGDTMLNPKGILIVLAIVVTYALYIVGINKSGVEKVDSRILTFYILLFSAFIFGAFAFSTTGIDKITGASDWINLLLLAFIPTVISNLTLVLAIKYAGSTITSILGSMEPLVAVIVGVVFFKEDFSFWGIIGLVIIIVSVMLVVVPVGRSKTVPAK